MAICDWPVGERPRERLMQHGVAALSDAELLAVFLRTGVRGKSAVELGRAILAEFGGLAAISTAPAERVCSIPGLGPAKFAELQAAFELARRALRESMAARDVLGSPGSVRDYLRLAIGTQSREIFLGVFLDTRNRVLSSEELFRGSLTQTSVYPREVVKRGLALNAAAVIFAHNHPSGVAEPSHADIALTEALKVALATVEIRVLDHFVVTGSTTLSFAERGLL